MPETAPSEVVDPSTLVTMADFNEWKSSTDAQMQELKDMMQTLMQRTLAPPPPPEIPGVTQEGESKDKPSEGDFEEGKGGDEDPKKNESPNASKGTVERGNTREFLSRIPSIHLSLILMLTLEATLLNLIPLCLPIGNF